MANNANATIWFTDPTAVDHGQVGGKGANLGRLTKSGFVVPPGFVVGTAAYAAHVEGGKGLKATIAEILGSVDYNDAAALDASVAKIRTAITSAAMPAQIAADIAAAYDKLGDIYVAVRSSGTAEDLAGASFAGLHDTYLDIRGRDNLLDAVKRCWASMWTSRAVFYRQTQGFDHFSSSIAVVVQTMVESEVSGVMFTGNPINTATDQVVITPSYGLGEAIVSGIVTPDEFIVRHDGLKILNRTLGSKAVEIIRNKDTGNGVVHLEVAEERRARFCMSDAQVTELAAIGLRIQEAYQGFPQDIEWAYQGGQFYVLQARPITGVEFSWDAEVTKMVRAGIMGWIDLIVGVARRAEQRFGPLGPLTPEEIGAFAANAFIGAESLHLLGLEKKGVPLRQSLRRIGDLIRVAERNQSGG